ERDAADIAISLSLAEEYASKHGAAFLFFVAPNKNTIYPQFMPDRYSPADSDDNCDLLYAALTQRGVSCLDLRPVFCNTEDTIYHRLDSHWNNTGAVIAEREILTSLGIDGVDRTAEEFEIRNDFSADLYEMAFPSGKISDEQRYYNLAPITENGTSEDIVYETSSDSAPGSLVMFRDSFGNALAPFLARDFGSAVFSRSVPYDATEIVEAQASALVIELAERNIINLKNRAIIFPAPVRDIDLPEKTFETEFTVSVAESDGLICITGNISLARDSGTPIYAIADGTVYEASPVGNGENAFTLYLENTPSDISLVLTIGGEKYIVHQ
ncbi:MAG: hypothetical protein HUJ65_02685, partial [Oscillospiraceae bacterium]|nr:hypothetical protein [Oscillospiraceae bacterium]